jgi:predicted ribosomally synthesized peptide with nif11-like leader
MSIESYRAFTARIEEDSKLRELMLGAASSDGMSVERLTSIASAHGYQFSVRDVSLELSEDLADDEGDAALDFAKVSHQFWKVAFDPVACSLRYFKYYR